MPANVRFRNITRQIGKRVLTPQCRALYANNFSTSWIDDLDDPENWGFGKNQVTPFYVNTHDGQRLHAWHILPRQLYARHEIDIVAQELGKENDLKSTFAYQLMSKTPSKLIITCKLSHMRLRVDLC